MFWEISSYPRCQYHVFLSHCAEDRQWLVHPVHDKLMCGGTIPWLDREDSYGRDSRTALRDSVLRSRHVVFFITLGMTDYRRGWCLLELAFADLLQANLTYPGGPLVNLILPLFFLPRDDAELPRTAWDSLRDRGRFHHPSDGDAVEWSVDQILAFPHREQELALEMARLVLPGRPIHTHLHSRPGLIERTTRFDPGPIP